MSEVEWNLEKLILLVENVQKYLFLYDGLVTHSDPMLVQKTWDKIAETIGEGSTGMHCKRRWQILRNAYNTGMRLGRRIQPLGIERHLSFLTPFIKTKIKPQAECSPEDSLEYCTRLVQIVKDYPALYYRTRNTTNSDIWQNVATRMGNGATKDQCHNQWIKLRTRYTIHMRRGFLMKPLGLEQHLAFLAPGLKCPEPSAKRRRKELETKRAQIRKNKAVAATLRHKHLRLDGQDEDTLFLMEFLQDMAKMSDADKISFKLDAMRLAKQFRYEDRICPWYE